MLLGLKKVQVDLLIETAQELISPRHPSILLLNQTFFAIFLAERVDQPIAGNPQSGRR
jgi:hypothetical protein